MEEAETPLVRGTLEMMILSVLLHGSMHGWGIGQKIKERSREVLHVDEGSLYPALHRLRIEGLVSCDWSQSENNRRALYYALTKFGRRQLENETVKWNRAVLAIANVMQ